MAGLEGLDSTNEEVAFIQEEVLAFAKEVHQCRFSSIPHTADASCRPFVCCAATFRVFSQGVDGVLANVTYSHTKVKQWTSMVRARASEHLADCKAQGER